MHDSNQRVILASSASRLPEAFKTTGFYPMPQSGILETLYNAGLWLGPRNTLELEPQFRQIIPYIVLVVDGKVVQYTRTPSGGESRLHGKVSVGLGGHIDLTDVATSADNIDLENTLDTAADREVLEELGCVDIISKTWIGLVVSNENPVDFVHIGAVAVWELSKAPDGVVEDALGNVSLSAPADVLAGSGDRLETWSKLVLSGQFFGHSS